VLGASAWEPSGLIPGQFIAQMPLGTTYSGDRGTYTGGTDGVVWIPQLGPYVTGSVVDYRSDISFLLANDPPMVSGFGAANAVQDLVYAPECGIGPCGIATGLDYMALSWDLGQETAFIDSRFGKFKDTFARDVSSGWGTPDYGDAYTPINALSDGLTYVVNGDGGFIATSAAASGFVGQVVTSGGGPNFDMTFDIRQLTDLVRLETRTRFRAYGRYVDSQNYYFLDLSVSPALTGGAFSVDDAIDAGVVLYAGVALGGVESIIDSRQLWPVPAGFGPATGWHIRWMIDGTLHKVKVWEDARSEPLLWNMEFENTRIDDGVQGGVILDPPSSALNAWGKAYALSAGSFAPTASNQVINFAANFTVPPLAELDNGVNVDLLTWGDLVPLTFAGRLTLSGASSADIRPQFTWSYNGINQAAVQSASSMSLYLVPGTRISVRAQLDTAFAVVRFAISYNTDLPNAVWSSVLGASVPSPGSIFKVYNSPGPVFTGNTIPDVGSTGFIVHSVYIADRTATRVDADFDNVPIAATSFVDDTGWTWTLPYPEAFLGARYGTGIGFAAQHSEGRALWEVNDIEVTPPRYWFGYHEIQREDDDDPGEWQTIMKATNPAITEFNDYEARPGIATRYRIRTVDKYDFTGPWSPEVSGMIPAPGAQGQCLDDGHLLLFTTNEVQDGSSNLAYASIWEAGTIHEDFTFPDAQVVQLQTMYNKNFYTAFRPMERLGEQFSRDLLVQAASMTPARLANFTSLRDLAWDDLNYVCVRDEDGNRWLASVNVPNGTVKRRRTLYFASIDISEVSETPTPVDPEWLP
jgi:hypothetical protein